MSSSNKCLCISHGSCWIFIIVLNILLIGAMIATIFIEQWVTLDISSNETFKGGLRQYYEPDDDTYEESRKDFCDAYDILKKSYESGGVSKSIVNQTNSLCKMFKSLDLAGNVYLGLESGAAFFVLIWIISMIFYYKKKSGLTFAYLFSFFSLSCHIAGFLMFVVRTKTMFGSCADLPTNGDAPELCAKAGPTLSLAISATLIVDVLIFVLVAVKVGRNKGFRSTPNDVQEDVSRIEESGNSGAWKKESANHTKVQAMHGSKGNQEHNSNRKF